MNEGKIVLPNRNEIFQRLRRTAGNTAELNKFYARLFRHADMEYSVDELIAVIINAIATHTVDMAPIEADILIGEVPRFIDALVDNKEHASLAKVGFRNRMIPA